MKKFNRLLSTLVFAFLATMALAGVFLYFTKPNALSQLWLVGSALVLFSVMFLVSECWVKDPTEVERDMLLQWLYEEYDEKKDRALEKISKSEPVTWEDIIYFHEYRNTKGYDKILESIMLGEKALPSLRDLVAVSSLKKMITWKGSKFSDFPTALELVESFAIEANDDAWKNLVALISELMDLADQHKGYKGSDALKKIINDKCPTVVFFI